MRIHLSLLLVATTLYTGPARADVYTANEAGDGLTVYHTSGPVTSFPLILPLTAHNVQYVEQPATQQHLLLMTAAATHHADGHALHDIPKGELVVFDADHLDQGPLWHLPVGTHPAHVVASPDGQKAYVTLTDENRIVIIDLTTRQITGTISTGAGPHGLRLSADGQHALVANMNAGSVSWLDLSAGQPTGEIQTGGTPIQTALSPNGQIGYVTLAGSNQLAVLDLTQQTIRSRIALTYAPAQVFVTPSYILVAQQGNASAPGNLLSIFDRASTRLIRDVPVCRGPHGVTASADEQKAYISCVYDNSLATVDLPSATLNSTQPGGQQPNGISWSAFTSP
jgi:YVTN family beta-propeller protein